MPTYIHERPDWPAFRWDMAVLADQLAAVRHRQGLFLGQMQSLGFPLRDEATLEALTDEVQKSSAIEGARLDSEQVRSSLAKHLGIVRGTLTPVDRYVDGVVEMTINATQRYDEPLTAERLFGWQAALFPTGRSGLWPINVGAWRDDRNGPMQLVSGRIGGERVHYEAPPAARLDAEMAAFLTWFAAPLSIDPVLKAALCHLWFVTIHPFDDGNGRIARAIADMALARSDGSRHRFYGMSSQIRKEQDSYYTILEATQRGDLDVTSWMHWFLDCLDRAFQGAETVLAKVLLKSRFWDALRGTQINERQQLMLNKLIDRFEGKQTTEKWAVIAKCSHDTALRDIQDLVNKHILSRDPAGGRSTSYSLSITPLTPLRHLSPAEREKGLPHED